MKKEEYVTFPQQPYSYSCHQQPLHQQQQHKVDINALQMEVEELRFLVGGEPRCYSCGRISRRITEDLKILNMHIMETMERLYKALHENSFDEGVQPTGEMRVGGFDTLQPPKIRRGREAVAKYSESCRQVLLLGNPCQGFVRQMTV